MLSCILKQSNIHCLLSINIISAGIYNFSYDKGQTEFPILHNFVLCSLIKTDEILERRKEILFYVKIVDHTTCKFMYNKYQGN